MQLSPPPAPRRLAQALKRRTAANPAATFHQRSLAKTPSQPLETRSVESNVGRSSKAGIPMRKGASRSDVRTRSRPNRKSLHDELVAI